MENAPKTPTEADNIIEAAGERPRIISIEADPSEDDRTGSTQRLLGTPEVENAGPKLRRILKRNDSSSNWSTLPSVYFLLVINVVMVLMVFIIPVICNADKDSQQCWIEPFSLLIYSHTLYWCGHLVVDQYLKFHHREGRLRGYVEFYVKTKNLRRSPFYITSVGNAVLLVTVTALHDYCDHDKTCEDKSTKIEALRGLITLECMVIFFMWVKYIMAVRKFKKEGQPPDLYRHEFREMVFGKSVFGNVERSPGSTQPAPTYPPEAIEESDILQLQSELLVYLCPQIGQELDMRRLVTEGSRYHPQVSASHPGGIAPISEI